MRVEGLIWDCKVTVNKIWSKFSKFCHSLVDKVVKFNLLKKKNCEVLKRDTAERLF